MKFPINLIISMIFPMIECSVDPKHSFLCHHLSSKTTGRFEGIQAYSHWYVSNDKRFKTEYKMFNKEMNKEWEFTIDFDTNGCAVGLKFDEKSAKPINPPILNRFSYPITNDSNPFDHSVLYSYDCITYEVFIEIINTNFILYLNKFFRHKIQQMLKLFANHLMAIFLYLCKRSQMNLKVLFNTTHRISYSVRSHVLNTHLF